MRLLLLLASCVLATAAYASSVWRPIDRTPFDAYRYTIAVDHQPLPGGGQRYTITVHLKEGRWPMKMAVQLSKLVMDKSGVSDFQKRALTLTGSGKDRTVAFDITQSEAAKWSFELQEYGESNGHLMPSISTYFFPLNRPPKS